MSKSKRVKQVHVNSQVLRARFDLLTICFELALLWIYKLHNKTGIYWIKLENKSASVLTDVVKRCMNHHNKKTNAKNLARGVEN